MTAPPRSAEELLARAEALAGRELRQVAALLGVEVPADQRRAKGWVGALLERALGASAGSRAEPDFPHLGIELKTLPVDASGKPAESTYVCTARLDGTMARTWEESWVCHKLARVLWVPIVGKGELAGRRVGAPILWRPSPDEEAVLRADWGAIAEAIALGETWQLEARRGVALQLRPKAASGDELTWMVDDEGEWAQVNPRGFYLRPSFTRAIVERALRAR
jgi:DNA mismatch repair protein MutH